MVDTLLYDHCRYVQLDVLTRDLAKQRQQLGAQLREVVNDSFDDFVRLGNSIVIDDDHVTGITSQLAQYQKVVADNEAAVAGSNDIGMAVVEHRRLLVALKTEAKLGLIVGDLAATFEELLTSGDHQRIVGTFLAIKDTFGRLPPLLAVAAVVRLKVVSATREFEGYVNTLEEEEKHRVNQAVEEVAATLN